MAKNVLGGRQRLGIFIPRRYVTRYQLSSRRQNVDMTLKSLATRWLDVERRWQDADRTLKVVEQPLHSRCSRWQGVLQTSWANWSRRCQFGNSQGFPQFWLRTFMDEGYTFKGSCKDADFQRLYEKLEDVNVFAVNFENYFILPHVI